MQNFVMSTELQVFAWSVILFFVHLFAQSLSTTASVGLSYGAGARDEGKEPSGVLPGRFKRALLNFSETYPVFIGLALALAVTGKSGGIAATGAVIWIIGRVVYLPLYALGIPYIRTLAWGVAIVGLIMMLIRLMS